MVFVTMVCNCAAVTCCVVAILFKLLPDFNSVTSWFVLRCSPWATSLAMSERYFARN